MALQIFVLDPDATALEDAPKAIRNETGAPLPAGDLLYITGWNEANSSFLVAKADADVPGAAARLVLRTALANLTNGFGFRTHRLAAIDTSAAVVVGDPVYLSTVTPGSWTLTAPTAATSFQQVVGRVAIDAVAGAIEFDLLEAAAVKAFGSSELQAAAVNASKLSNTAARDNLNSMADVDRRYVRTTPVTGEYKIIDVRRDATGKLEVEYDDVVIP